MQVIEVAQLGINTFQKLYPDFCIQGCYDEDYCTAHEHFCNWNGSSTESVDSN